MHYQLAYIPYDKAILIIMVCTLVMFAAMVTGIIVHKNIFKDFFTFRPRKGQRSWLDGHNLLSVTALPFHLVVTYSGFLFFTYQFMPSVPDLLYADGSGRSAGLSFYEGVYPYPQPALPPASGSPASLVQLPALLNEVDRQWGRDIATALEVRNPGDASARVLVKPLETVSIAYPENMLVFDGASGRLVENFEPRHYPSATGDHVMKGLHKGLFADWFLRVLLLFMGVGGTAMIGTGLFLWANTRRTRLLAAGVQPHFGVWLVDRLNIGTVIGMPVAIAAYFWANRLLPAELASRAAWEVHVMYLTMAALFAYPMLRPPEKARIETLWLCAAAYGLLPVLNALTTSRHLGYSLPHGDWIMAGFDLTALACAAIAAICALKVRHSAAHVVPRRRPGVAGVAAAMVALVAVLGMPSDAASAETSRSRQLEELEIAVVRAEDISAIKTLQRAYGYYADRGLWNELADLFADDAIANYPSGGFDGQASIRAMFVQNLGQGRQGLAEGRIYNHTILQPVVDLAPDGASATGRWRVLGMLGRFGASAIWADSLYRFDYVKRDGRWRIRELTAYAGSGGGYDAGWVKPAPRPPNAAASSPIRNNLAHPADRPWIDPCEADVSVCVVPFPYPNRGTMRPPAEVAAQSGARLTPESARAADLVRRAQRLADEQAVLNLQRSYGYHVDRGEWRQAAALFAPDGTREAGQSGVYAGRERIRQSLALTGPEGLRAGQLNDHLQLEPIVHVAPDGRSAQARIFELAFTGGGGEPARLVQNVAENTYVRRGDGWAIQRMHIYTILATDYAQGWAKSALPAPGVSATLPPDQPPTVRYEAYPAVFTPPLHFAAASVGGPMASVVDSRARGSSARELSMAVTTARRVMDHNEIENLQNAYGYYAEKFLWSEIVALFTDDVVVELEGFRSNGRQQVLASLRSRGPEGPVPGALDSQLQLQPVIEVAADGRSATMRSRLLQLSRDAEGRPMWGAGIYTSKLRKQDGVWRFERLSFRRTYLMPYKGGWAEPAN